MNLPRPLLQWPVADSGRLEIAMATRQRPRKASRTPRTYFAPPERATAKDLQAAIALASHNPIIDTVMQAFGGLVAVLNDKRQILAVNHALLAALGIEDAKAALGLRPGEAVCWMSALASTWVGSPAW